MQSLRSRADRLAEYHAPARQRMRARDRRDTASHKRRSDVQPAPHRQSPRELRAEARLVETRSLPRVRQEWSNGAIRKRGAREECDPRHRTGKQKRRLMTWVALRPNETEISHRWRRRA